MPGGVCAVLDYDVELMAEYVSEMATRVVTSRNVVKASFRKFVSQILTSTRLPSTTILLGLNYLAKRINMMHASGKSVDNEGEIWRMFTVALLLGSKFLDDNTFQNKSWSEVSGIQVAELNKRERDWLQEIGWTLYVNLDESQDYQAWLQNWKEWLENKRRQQAHTARLAALHPIETNLAHQHSPHAPTWHQQQIAEYEAYERLKGSQNPGPNPAIGYQYFPVYSSRPHLPPTPPDSGYGTPEYVSSDTLVNTSDWFDKPFERNGGASRHYQVPAAHNKQYPSYSAQAPWDRSRYYSTVYSPWGHPSPPSHVDCYCASCMNVLQSQGRALVCGQ